MVASRKNFRSYGQKQKQTKSRAAQTKLINGAMAKDGKKYKFDPSSPVYVQMVENFELTYSKECQKGKPRPFIVKEVGGEQ